MVKPSEIKRSWRITSQGWIALGVTMALFAIAYRNPFWWWVFFPWLCYVWAMMARASG